METYPEVAKRSMCDSFDDIFQEAYETKHGHELHMAAELATLRWHLYRVIELNCKSMGHIVDYEQTVSENWLARLADRLAGLANKSRKKKTNHTWLN